MKKIITLLIMVASVASFTFTQAGEIGHYNGGIMDIRDYFIPEPGFYGLVYNYFYFSDRLNDRNGNQISSVIISTPSGPLDVNVNVQLHSYALMPVLMWVAPHDIWGTKYSAYIAPSFANNSLGTELSLANRTGGSLNSSSFGVGDLYVQPLWFDQGFNHSDFSLAYGFYAPVGRYNMQKIALPNSTSVTVGSANNIGLGFWTQQAQAGIAWYPMTNKVTAVTAIGTYEYNGAKQDTDIKPGQMMTLNWGVSQYLPLSNNQELLLEVGPAGYDSYQITD